ncbi:uncharacterized protein PV09_04764 [Verruconis gallopava]|uniref:Uncharacterized protein n=1 Tax=Verruconis gallopava TaxID=253628 RepID=A0A0D2AAX0_9PEZI|nr:uncharacterized protein PV09_04764 [Verruconis gallopava]KIW03923.1 hypothetical protein PV09_04764 [Verruconis gallopava]
MALSRIPWLPEGSLAAWTNVTSRSSAPIRDAARSCGITLTKRNVMAWVDEDLLVLEHSGQPPTAHSSMHKQRHRRPDGIFHCQTPASPPKWCESHTIDDFAVAELSVLDLVHG